MDNNVISAKQMRPMVALYIIGSSLVTGASSAAGQDTWIGMVFGFLLSLPLILVHTAILNLYPGRNYPDAILKIYGKAGGRIVILFYSVYVFHLGGMVLRTFAEFIRTVNMTETPLIAIMAFILIVSVFLMKNRVNVLARVSKFVFPLLVITLILTLILSIKDMDLKNIKPVFGSGFRNIFAGSWFFFAVPFGEVVVCAPLFEGLDRKNRILPVFFKGALYGFLVLFAANLRNILVLGYSTSVFPFASYESVSVISYGEFFTRIEVLIGINLLLAGFIKVCVLIFAVSRGFSKAFDLGDYVPYVVPGGLLILSIALVVHSDTNEMYVWLYKYMPVYSVPFQIVLPILTLIIGTVRKKIAGKKTGKKKPARQGKDARPGEESEREEEAVPQP